MHKTLEKSIQRNGKIEMIYMDDQSRITKRWVKVFKANEQTFVGFCYFRRAVRTFKISNVLALVPVVNQQSFTSRSVI